MFLTNSRALATSCLACLLLSGCGDSSPDDSDTADDVGFDSIEEGFWEVHDEVDDRDSGDSTAVDTADDLGNADDAADATTDDLGDDSGPDAADDVVEDLSTDTVNPDDRDGDGITTALDCDDDNENLGAIALDADCDGVTSDIDCDDSTADVTSTNVDNDLDGFTGCMGDCCDDESHCAFPARVSPRAIELPTETGALPVDDNCDGDIDEISEPCDADIVVPETSPDAAAHAIGLCLTSAEAGAPGLAGSRWIRSNGAARVSSEQNGIKAQFGVTLAAREGDRMLVLSTGKARDVLDPGSCGGVSCELTGVGTAPAGAPFEFAGCTAPTSVYDDVGFEVTLRVPANATGFSVDVNMLVQDYPETLCSPFNDQFAIFVTPTVAGSISGNVAFDARGTPLGVNFDPLAICSGCELGDNALTGTGFDRPSGGAATGWMTVTAPVTAGDTIVVRFVIWDSNDANFDSTALIDNFRWLSTTPVVVSTTPIW